MLWFDCEWNSGLFKGVLCTGEEVEGDAVNESLGLPPVENWDMNEDRERTRLRPILSNVLPLLLL